jgi:hypothetical protein
MFINVINGEGLKKSVYGPKNNVYKVQKNDVLKIYFHGILKIIPVQNNLFIWLKNMFLGFKKYL